MHPGWRPGRKPALYAQAAQATWQGVASGLLGATQGTSAGPLDLRDNDGAEFGQRLGGWRVARGPLDATGTAAVAT